MNSTQAGVYASAESLRRPSCDFTLTGAGGVMRLHPLTPDAVAWVEENIPPDAMHWSGAAVLDVRELAAMVESIVGNGLRIGKGL